jgi:choline dehydrogenase-like flavoprotein
MIRDASELPQGFTTSTRVCVVGSGAGGGTVAGLLAEAGWEVVLLEEGEHVPRERMTQREEQMYPLLYRDGGNQLSHDGGVNVLQGSALGGSTVINYADVTDIPEPVLAHWRGRYGLGRHSLEAWQEAAAAARRGIQANHIPRERVNRNGQLLLEGGRKLKLPGARFTHNRVGCVDSGYCGIGCAYDAKKSTALTWIPRGLATGKLLVQTQARVQRLERDGTRIRAVSGTLSNGASFRVEAEHVVLAAGAIHSPLLLQGAGVGGSAVGWNLSLQPQAPVTALFDEEVRQYRGIPQSAYIDAFETNTAEHGLGGFRLESVGSGPGMSAASTLGWGPEAMELMAGFNNVAACLCLVPDAPGGRVTARWGQKLRPRIRYALQDDWRSRMRAAIRLASHIYLEAGARMVLAPLLGARPMRTLDDLDQIDALPLESNRMPIISAHPQGTCRVGPDPANSVVDERFFVHGLDNLQVLDASVFPSSASSHTMIPVMQVAHLGVAELI